MADTNLNEVKRLQQMLADLLQDAQPGLFVWCMAYHSVLNKLGKLSTKNPSDQYVDPYSGKEI